MPGRRSVRTVVTCTVAIMRTQVADFVMCQRYLYGYLAHNNEVLR
jgi:hypothetical protein